MRIIKDVFNSQDKEAVRMSSQMPNRTPDKHNGKNVKVQFKLLVKFVINDERKLKLMSS